MLSTLDRTSSQRNGQTVGFPTTWEMIDPELATLYLERNVHNRKLDRRQVVFYAMAMQRGEWMPNGDTIRFSSRDVLLNGQHTLAAIVESGKSQLCCVIRGLPDEVFKTIDKQKRRNDGHDLHRAGYKNCYALAATIRMLWSYETYRSTQSPTEQRLTSEQILKIAESIPAMSESVDQSCNLASGKLLTTTVACLLWFTGRGLLDKRSQFFGILGGDIAATKKHPAGALRERCLTEKSSRRRSTSWLSTALAIKAWNLHCEGREVGCLKLGDSESFPIIHGYGDELTATFPEWIPSTLRT